MCRNGSAGDGILAEFSSVPNAVNCAIAIQRKMAERNATWHGIDALAASLELDVAAEVVAARRLSA